MKQYIVGGFVRDTLMGKVPKDKDFVVIGATPQEMLDAGYKQVGADFPVFLKDGCEYALARKDRKSGNGYKGFVTEFDPSITLEDDCIRRDLTINSIAMDEDTGAIIDLYGGVEDIKNKILRHTSSAFSEDPLRVLRVARFAARYPDFSIHPDTLDLMKSLVAADELKWLSTERIYLEFEKAFAESNCIRFIDVLLEIGALHKIDQAFAEHLEREKNSSSWEMYTQIFSNLTTSKHRLAWILHVMYPVHIQEFCKKLRVPNEIRDLALHSVNFVLTVLCSKTPNVAGRMYVKLFDELNVTQSDKIFDELLTLHFEADAISTGWLEKSKHLKDVYKSFTYASLTHEQQVQLKGREIKKFIFDKRVELINQVIR